MDLLESFKIDIFNLQKDTYHFNFTFDSHFFQAFAYDLIENGKGTCQIELVPSETMILFCFRVNGIVELVCDRSLELFDYPINFEKKIIYKYGSEKKELSEDVYLIPRNEKSIKFATFLHEFILLEIPMKRLHPKFANSLDNKEELFYSSRGEEASDTFSDPRWKILEQLNN